MNDEDDNMSSAYVVGWGAAASDTITIAADDLTTINLSDILDTTPTRGATPIKPGSWDSLFGPFGGKDTEKKSTVYDLDVDPFASIIEIKAEGRFPEIERIKNHIPSSETNEYAQTIRNYFLDKVITQKLSGQYRDSDFKRDMVKALKLSGKQVLEDDHIRLLYRLPDFYQEDIFKDALVETSKSFPDYKGKTSVENAELTYVGSIDHYRKGHRAKEFYFRNSDNYVFVISSVQSAILLPLTVIFDQIKSLTVTGNFNYNKLKGHDMIVASFNHKYTVNNFVF